jgi:hypothetical protein
MIGPGGGISSSLMFILFIGWDLSMKEGSLFCFVCRTQISSGTRVLHVALLVSPASSLDEYGCTDLVRDCLEPLCESYWYIEPFSQWKLNKIKNWKHCIGMGAGGGEGGVIGKPLASQIL